MGSSTPSNVLLLAVLSVGTPVSTSEAYTTTDGGGWPWWAWVLLVQSIITAIVLIAVAIVLPRRYEKFRKRQATRSKSVKHRPDTSSESESEESSSDESSHDDDSESGERRSLRHGHRSHRGRDLPPTAVAPGRQHSHHVQHAFPPTSNAPGSHAPPAYRDHSAHHHHHHHRSGPAELPPTTSQPGASRSHGMFSTMHMPSGVQLPSWASKFGVRGGHIST
mmetsp:Transcript_9094/g.25387  ORF Transcript_9094/g.25387 Transcript_9094/m.25387 type:complete len:221 (-) Transcript_9094:73-735(-)